MGQITVEGWAGSFPAGRGTLLDAALDAGVPVPYQCRAGECGQCRCHVEAGSVRSDPCLPEALSDEQAAAGWILACRSRPLGDLHVRFANPLAPPRPRLQRIPTQVAAIDRVSRDVVRLQLACRSPLDFHAGQYVALEFPGLPPRNYSPANLPGGTELEFFVRLQPNGAVSGHIVGEAAAGDPLKVSGPHGDACLPGAPSGPVLAVAGGTGLAPVLSILRQLARVAPETRAALYFGARSRADIFASKAADDLRAALPNLAVHRVLSEDDAPGSRKGFIAPHLLDDLPDLRGWDCFLAGPPPLVDSVRAAALTLGADPERIRADPFTTAAPEAAHRRTGLLRRVFASALGR